MKALKVGGVEDHVHILLSLPSTLDIAKAVQLLKGNSSKWIHETFPKLKTFEWQEGYGAFRIGVSYASQELTARSHQAKLPKSQRLRKFAERDYFLGCVSGVEDTIRYIENQAEYLRNNYPRTS